MEIDNQTKPLSEHIDDQARLHQQPEPQTKPTKKNHLSIVK